MDRSTASAVPSPARRLACWLALLASVVLASSAWAQTRIGYVDMKRLVDNAPQMASGNERLRAEFAERDRLLKADEGRLVELQDQQRQQTGSANTAAAQALAAEIEALERKVRRTRETLREELRRRSEQEIEVRWRQINETVAAFAREQNYDLIVSSPVFYASPAIDITDQVLTRLRQEQAQPARPADGG